MKLIYFLPFFLLLKSCSTNAPQNLIINFKADACFGPCPIFTMKIQADGVAVYDAKMFNNQKGLLKTIIRKEQLDSLNTLIQNADIFSLRDRYTALVTDQPTYTLIIKEKNGRTKIIEDYGSSGPDRLEKINDFIFSLRDTQSWK